MQDHSWFSEMDNCLVLEKTRLDQDDNNANNNT